MLEIFAIKQTQKIERKKFKKLIFFTSDMVRERISRYINWQDAQRTLIADLLIRSIIVKKLGITNSQIKFVRNKYGKPFLSNQNGFFFNLSHSGDWVVCAVDENEVGVDVEKMEPIDFTIAKRYFSNDEYAALMSLTGKNREKYFYSLWTLKESYLKAIGKGLSLPLNKFGFSINGESIILKNSIEDHSCYFMQYPIGVDYLLSVCAVVELKERKIFYQELDEIVADISQTLRS